MDNKERDRYRTFQKGTFLIKGWQARKEEVLAVLPADDRDDVASRLDRLGEKIGREWARHPRIRQIDTPMLQKWGKRLRQARTGGAGPLIAEIQNLEKYVDDMLA